MRLDVSLLISGEPAALPPLHAPQGERAKETFLGLERKGRDDGQPRGKLMTGQQLRDTEDAG